MLKRTVIGLFTAILSMAAFAAELQLPPTALSNVPPNDLKVVVVAEFSSLADHHGASPKEMTIRDLTANRPTISSNGDGKMLCEVKSISDPDRKQGGICVSAQINPATVTVKTFKNATGEPISGERTIAVNDFVVKATSAQAKDATNFDCIVKDGKNIGVCVIASSN